MNNIQASPNQKQKKSTSLEDENINNSDKHHKSIDDLSEESNDYKSMTDYKPQMSKNRSALIQRNTGERSKESTLPPIDNQFSSKQLQVKTTIQDDDLEEEEDNIDNDLYIKQVSAGIDPTKVVKKPKLSMFQTPQKEKFDEYNNKGVRESNLSNFNTNQDMLESQKRRGETNGSKDDIYEAENLEEQSLSMTLVTIVQYMIADIQKKPTSFMIGVFSIFLVVSFVTMLKSVVDIAGVAFIKMGQDQAGVIDFQLTSNYKAPYIDGNRNFYIRDDPFIAIRKPEEPDEDDENLSSDILPDFSNMIVEQGDNAVIADSIHVLKFDMFKDKLEPLVGNGFDGFSPRWTYPVHLRNTMDSSRNTSAILIIIDSLREIEIGLGKTFSQLVLGRNEMIATESALNYIGVDADSAEQVELYIDIDLFMASVKSTDEVDTNEDMDFVGNLRSKYDYLKLKYQHQTPTETLIDMMRLYGLNQSDYNMTALIEDFNQDWQIKDLDDSEEFDSEVKQYKKDSLNNSDIRQLEEDLSLPTNNYVEMTKNYKIVDSFTEPKGKFPGNYGNVAIIDCHYANDIISKYLDGSYTRLMAIDHPEDVRHHLQKKHERILQQTSFDLDFCNYALSIEGVMSNQTENYLGDSTTVQQNINRAGAQIMDAITLDSNFTLSTPVHDKLDTYFMVLIFLDSSMAIIIAFLCLLAIQLIYSLMLSDVSDKTYTFGLLRALGFKTSNLITLISMQSFMFSLPGLCLGMVVAALINVLMRFGIFFYSANSMTYMLSDRAVMIGTVIGLCVPMVTNIFPVQKALDVSLRSSLDPLNRQSQDVTVKFVNIANMGLSPQQTLTALILVVLGFLCYYVAPISYLFQDYQTFFLIMNILLLLMILGFTLLSILFLPYLQYLFINLFECIFKHDKTLWKVVRKNQEAHQNRNTKTAIMFSIALSFLIFTGSTLDLLGHLVVAQMESYIGSDLLADATYSESNINEGPLTEFLLEQQALGFVKDFTYQSRPLKDVMKALEDYQRSDYQNQQMSSLSGFGATSVQFCAIQENFLQVVDAEYYQPIEVQPGSDCPYIDDDKQDIACSLYRDISYDSYQMTLNQLNESQGGTLNFTNPYYPYQINLVVPEGLRNVMSIDTNSSAKIQIGQLTYTSKDMVMEANIKSMAQRIPGNIFSSYSQITSLGVTALMSQDQYWGVLNHSMNATLFNQSAFDEAFDGQNFTQNVPKMLAFIQLEEDITDTDRENIADQIRAYLDAEKGVNLLDKHSIIQSAGTLLIVNQLVLGLIGIVALTLSFFLLMISTTQNINTNVWEFGVLRSIGVDKDQSVRIYLYESFSVILSALTLGTFVGFTTAATLTAQFYLFMELPYVLSFPWILYGILVSMSLLTTYYAVLYPVTKVVNSRVAAILKGNI